MKLFSAALLATLAFAPFTHAQEPQHHDDAAPMPMHKPVPASHSLNVIYQGRVTNLTVEDLLALPQHTLHVHNAHRNTDESYSGPLLIDVLAKAGMTVTPETETLIKHSALVATGTDKYYVVYAAIEAAPSFSKGQIIVAVMKAGLPDEEGGLIQLINDSDKKPARWVHGLANLTVMSLQQNP
ncbi:hypothetical protein ACFQBQ_02630 [Granulicella cerasi]|uniref:Oxidoreductase molybdopterin-binding domain-containing protein n=1 Tax=Granulicella cerasi TaxID=741063 RepID=A0ABW1Z752_9BACT|nr:hypothetical protein [Granulicella cerasi]